MCLAPHAYDVIAHKTYLMKIMKKYSIDLMELSFEVKENMSEKDYLWVTKFIKNHYDGCISYLDKPAYIVDTSPKEVLEGHVDNLLQVLEFMKEVWDAFTSSAAIVEAGGKSNISWEEGEGTSRTTQELLDLPRNS